MVAVILEAGGWAGYTVWGVLRVTVQTLEEGWLEGVRQVLSPNQDERPSGVAVDLLVVHGISLPEGHYGTAQIQQLFTNTLEGESFAGMRVSAHFLIERQGALTQYVSVHRRAWHAGESCFQGRSCCNDYSVGVELEGTDHEAYTDVQYEVLAGLTRALVRYYPGIVPERMVGHCDIAPGRKTDPGPCFEWSRLRGLLTQYA